MSVHTLADYANTYRLFCEYLCDDCSFSEITRSQIGAFLAAQPVSKKTVYNYHIGLSALWTWAFREGYTPEHVVQQTPRPRPEEPEIIPYTQDDFERLLAVVERSRIYKRPGKAACSNGQPFAQRHRAMLLLLLDTGIRVSELSTLKIHQVELRNRRINVWGKGSKQREIPISDATADALWKYLVTRKEDSMGDYVFITKQGKQLKPRRILDIIQNLADRAGIQNANVHRFRHTFAINYLRNGGDIYTLKRILGHSTLTMVQRYLLIAQADVASAHRKASPVSNWGL